MSRGPGSSSTGNRIIDLMAAPSQEKRTGEARRCGDGNAKAMRIEVVTLFPELVEGASSYGVTGRARERGLWMLGTMNPRDFATDRHKSVDDRPYGGGRGMVMLAEPLEQAIGAARRRLAGKGVPA